MEKKHLANVLTSEKSMAEWKTRESIFTLEQLRKGFDGE